MSVFENANRVKVTELTVTQVAAAAGSSVTVNNQSGQMGIGIALDKLSAAAAHSAMHDSEVRFNAPRCHRNTRTTYLDAFERWMIGLEGEYDGKRLIWLNGGAGAGKSAIMQSIIERCAAHAIILGSFFFSRTDSSRNHAAVLIPTLAYQLARAFPAALTALEPIIQSDPLIFKSSLQTQAYKLLVCPLLHLVATGIIDSTIPHHQLFVIDGLDECHDTEKQAHIIHVVATILCDYNVPVRFLVASRPEIAISRAFHSEKRLHAILSSVTLDDNAEATADIRRFIEDSFFDILESHPLRGHIPPNWPHPYDIDRLVMKSSGHFIHAATAMKFISSSDEHPSRALEVVEGLVPSRNGSPFAELDALYLHILTSAKYSSQVLEILRFCTFSRLEKSVTVICFMYPQFSPGDIELFLSDMHALVSLTPNQNAELCITLKHASLNDFLADEDRSQQVYISRNDYRASLLPHYFYFLDDCPLSPVSDLELHCSIISELNIAIRCSQDTELLQSLMYKYSPYTVWMFFPYSRVENYSAGLNLEKRGSWSAIPRVSEYMHAIRDSAANHDNILYTHHFKTYIQVLMEAIKPEPDYYNIIPALIFSSSPSCLNSVALHICMLFPQYIHWEYQSVFEHISTNYHPYGTQTHFKSYQAIRTVPQAQMSWGQHLANGLELVLQHLLGYTWTPEIIQPSLHKKWLNKTKPFTHRSQGSPKLASAFYSYLHTLPTPQPYGANADAALRRHGFSAVDAWERSERREKCYVYLQAIIHYLHKCDSTSTLAKLACKSLPKAALWFPRLMKRARAHLDVYVRCWEESPAGVLEKAQSFTINEMD